MHNQIYKFLRKIPKDKVISYKQIWQIFGLHPRLVANILSRNQSQDIFPCYKVINSNWKIWWYNLWIETKIKKLQRDWIEVKNNKVSTKYFWEIKK